MRWALAAVMTVLASAVMGQAAPFLQQGADAGRTGAVADAGPERFDVAYVRQLEGRPFPLWGPRPPVPIIVGEHAYVATNHYGNVPYDRTMTAPQTGTVWQIDLRTGTVEAWLELGAGTSADHLASDGTRMFVAGMGVLNAHLLEDGAPAWSAPVVIPAAGATPARCASLLVEGADVVAVCHYPEAVEAGIFTSGSALWVGVVGTANGTLWASFSSLEAQADVQKLQAPVALPGTWIAHAAADARHVVVLVSSFAHPATTMTTAWVLSRGLEIETIVYPQTTVPALGAAPLLSALDDARDEVGQVLLTDDRAYLLFKGVAAYDRADWSFLWHEAVGVESILQGGYGGLALDGSRLAVLSGTALAGLDVAGPTRTWDMVVPGAPGRFDGLLATPRHLLVALDGGLSAINPNTQESTLLLPRRGQADLGPAVAIGEGFVIAVDGRARVAVLGDTHLNIRPHLHASPEFPAAGEPFHVDASATVPGAESPAHEYRVEWGDGSASDWQRDPGFVHAYASDGPKTFTLWVRNAAGQVASVDHEVKVGHVPPVGATFLESAFSRANQETTFFVLGLMVTTVAGGVAALRIGRKRARLRRELAQVDAIAARNADHPLSLHRAMSERHDNAKTLLVAGRLDEAQYAVLRAHIDQVAAGGRMESIERDFPFLPVGLAASMQRMLDDGRITRWERASFRQALAADELLTASQKDKVRARMDAWFREDR